ncbi:MAG: hypothetical protein ABJM06_09475 [Gilvibacter sp.]
MKTTFPQDIYQKLQQDFGADYKKALQLLEPYAKREPEVSMRIHRGIVYVANGNFEKLEQAIELALTDWRDLIMWAEYEGTSLDDAVRVRDFTRTFAENGL